MSFLLVHFRSMTAEVLCIFADSMAFTGGFLACAFCMVETATEALGEALDVLVLRHLDERCGVW